MARKATKTNAPLTTAQRLGSLVKSARDIMRMDKGLNGDLDRLPMLTWVMFLKFLDDHEQVREERAKMKREKYHSAIEAPYRWRDWAAREDGISGDALKHFINYDEAVRPDGSKGAGLLAYLRGLQSSNGDDRRDVIASVFAGVTNRMESGYLLRDVINKVNGIHFDSTEEIHIVSSHYFLFGIDERKLDRRFLGYFIRTPAFHEQVTAQGSTNYAAIRPGHVLGYQIPLPPLAEQQRLVERIDALAAKVEEARRLRNGLREETESFLPAFLGDYFRKLSERHKPVPLAELTTTIIDGPHKTPTYVPTGIPFVTVKNMVTGQLDFSDLQYVTPEDHAEFTRRCKPERSDVLYSKDGATRGRPCFIDTDREFSIFVSVALIKPVKEKLDGRYLCHLLNSTMIKDRMTEKSRGDMIPHIVLREIKSFPVPAPSLEEQRQIVEYLDQIQAKVNELERCQGKARQELDAMLPAILDRAFKGE
jgi:restriction endonuclease S subunit